MAVVATRFFGSLNDLRSGRQLAAEVVEQAREHCKGGHPVRDLGELYQWMSDQNPEMPFWDNRIADGAYPAALAAFVASSCWEPWQMHAVYVMHGEIYLARLKAAKSQMDHKSYRDHFAGASMHRANGLTHMVRCAAEAGLVELEVPCWDAPRSLVDIATQAVADMRTACSLRSEKYGQPGCSEGTVRAFQAALKNLADALEVHCRVSKEVGGSVDRMVARLRESATNLSLTNQKTLAACSAGSSLAAQDQRSVEREVRLGDGAVYAIATHQAQDVESPGNCVQCRTKVATHRGHSCRCLCMCADCVAAAGTRVLECPNCEEFTEFVRA